MTTNPDDMRALAQAFEAFTKTTQTLEESYRLLEARLNALDTELADKNRQLEFALDYLNSLLESMSDGVIAVDPRGIVTAFNRAASAVLGYAPEEVIGQSFEAVFGRSFATPPARAVMELRARDGRAVPVNERDSPMTGRDGQRIGAVKVFHDLSELEELRAQVRQKERLAALGEMAATVAHEIRNPLGGLMGFAELLARDLGADDPRTRHVTRILAGARQLEGVVNELLEYTRPLQLALDTVNLARLFDEVLGYAAIKTDRIHVVLDVPPDLEIEGDTARLRQVFLNILINAAQSIEGEGTVRVVAQNSERDVRIDIHDTGCGMPAEQTAKVFSPFFTTKEQGTGLGLAVAAKIIEGHGGAVQVQSALGQGTTFTVLLPRRNL